METNAGEDQWDFYFCEIDGKPHSTMVNLSLVSIAPLPGLSLFHCLAVTLKRPNPGNGMTTREEFQALRDIDEVIFGSQSEQLKYVASQTGDGKRKFYFYAANQSRFAAVKDTFKIAFPDYETSDFNFEDGDWQTYFDQLYPNAIGMNEIKNRAVYVQLEANGDDLTVPRTIDHVVLFADRTKAAEFEAAVHSKGFEVTVRTDATHDKPYDLLVQRVDAPTGLDPITLELEALAESLGGTYDGWGCATATTRA